MTAPARHIVRRALASGLIIGGSLLSPQSIRAALPGAGQSAPSTVPATFRHGLVFVEPRTRGGAVIRFYTDTGGGWNAISRSRAESLGLANIARESVDGDGTTIVEFPAFAEGEGIPRPDPAHFEGGLVLAPDERLLADGFLGGRWFANRVWDFNYPVVGAIGGSALQYLRMIIDYPRATATFLVPEPNAD